MRNHRAPTIGAALVLLVGCAPPGLAAVAANHGLANDAIVRLDATHAVAASITATGQVQVVYLQQDRDGWRADVIGSATAPTPGDASARLLGYGGETQLEWNTFFYGTAPPGTSRVTVEGFAFDGGHVSNGAWIIALKEEDVNPDQLHWTFLSVSGGTIASGTGIFPPDA